MVTLKELAKELNVSVSTVSKALSDSYEISLETKKKILALAKERNYIPNNTAVNLRRRTTKTIGVVIPNIFNHFYTKILYGIESEAKKNGYKTVISISNENLESEKESLDYFTNGSVDGILLAPSDETEKTQEISHIEELRNKNIPFVMFDRYIDNFPVDKVIVNDFESSKNIIEYFSANGKQNILIVTLLKNLKIGELRKKGALSVNDNLLIVENDNEKQLQKQLQQILQSKKVDAIFALDELSGIISLNLTRELNFKIPQEIAIISFSQGVLSKYSYPRISTISQHAKKMGKESFKLLLERFKNNDKDYKTKVINTTLNLYRTT